MSQFNLSTHYATQTKAISLSPEVSGSLDCKRFPTKRARSVLFFQYLRAGMAAVDANPDLAIPPTLIRRRYWGTVGVKITGEDLAMLAAKADTLGLSLNRYLSLITEVGHRVESARDTKVTAKKRKTT